MNETQKKKYKITGLMSNITLWATSRDEVHRRLKDLGFEYSKQSIKIIRVYD